jgi:oligopeptide/dipeptide ABC transporter ATP-binding protein
MLAALAPSGATTSGDTHEPVLVVDDLRVSTSGGAELVRGVSLQVSAGEVVGLVGESGSGKSITALAIVGLLPPGLHARGSIRFSGRELADLDEQQRNRLRGRSIGIIFQDALRALNPMLSVRRQLTEAMRYHLGLTRKEAEERAIEWLRAMRIADPKRRLDDHPHQLSGGMRQRVMAAIALACEPDLLIADEPSTAVDVTVQAEILELLRAHVERHRTALVFITHDFGAVAAVCDRVAVMYAGRIVETADVVTAFDHPAHPYTRALLRTVPRIDREGGGALESIPGTPPVGGAVTAGCAFEPRCPIAIARCVTEDPALTAVSADHRAACHRADDVVTGAA